MDLRALKCAALLRFSSGALILGGLFFGSAGTLRYWQAWLFLGILFLPVAFVVRYLLRNDPELLQRRLAGREERRQQKTIQMVGGVLWLVTFMLPGLDRRFGWSPVPPVLVIVADSLVLAGYLVFFLTLRENRFASRIIKVEEGQTVIASGPYAIVRHPMYLGISVMLLFSPLALGSYWALIPAVGGLLLLVPRITDEEKTLLEELPGYREYTGQTPFRLIPGVW